MEKFRLLRSEDIEVKVKKVTDKGAILLLYKTARTDMDILDETVGAENWDCDYKEIKGNLYCIIGIRFPVGLDGERWVYKSDCGIESREDGDGNEKKGEASDAFKRAGFKWGIGRELYTAPFIFVSADRMNIDRTGPKPKTWDTFRVDYIGYTDRKITELRIINNKTGAVAFSYGVPMPPAKAPKGEAKRTPSPQGERFICAKCGKEITDYMNDGQPVTAEQHVKRSQKVFGETLCLECISHAKAG